MNHFWSDRIQSIGTLDSSRKLRFSDRFQNAYTELFRLEEGARILEIGCGTGALCRALKRWYPSAEVVGLDRDDAFIDYARERNTGETYRKGDATALPFADGSFDVTISNTVSEHVEPSGFFGEQRRVLRDGGVCLLLSARRGIQHPAACVREESAFETEIWERVDADFRRAAKENGVGAYALNEMELPAAMEKYGFRDVETHYLAINLTPDDPFYAPEEACDMINANRQNDLDNIERMESVAPGAVSRADREMLARLVNERYDRRLALYEAGEKQWDVTLGLTMLLRGVK
ncbi:MAG: methyltransferase domain-containing protein [Clostridiales bacterium]|nr:methyltransferase domain-containing protein [Clostridiales bacterium]